MIVPAGGYRQAMTRQPGRSMVGLVVVVLAAPAVAGCSDDDDQPTSTVTLFEPTIHEDPIPTTTP